MNNEDGQVYSLCNCSFLVLLSTTVWSQNINKQIVNIVDEILTDYSFLSRYHYTKSKNYLKRRYINFVTEFPCLLGHPCIIEHIFHTQNVPPPYRNALVCPWQWTNEMKKDGTLPAVSFKFIWICFFNDG